MNRVSGKGLPAMKDLIDRWLAAWTSEGDGTRADLLLSFYTDDCYYSDPYARNGISGKEDLGKYFARLLSKNPYWRWEALEIIPTAKGCVLKWRAVIPVKGKSLIETGLDIIEIKEGLIARNEVYFDTQRWLKEQEKA